VNTNTYTLYEQVLWMRPKNWKPDGLADYLNADDHAARSVFASNQYAADVFRASRPRCRLSGIPTGTFATPLGSRNPVTIGVPTTSIKRGPVRNNRNPPR